MARIGCVCSRQDAYTNEYRILRIRKKGACIEKYTTTKGGIGIRLSRAFSDPSGPETNVTWLVARLSEACLLTDRPFFRLPQSSPMPTGTQEMKSPPLSASFERSLPRPSSQLPIDREGRSLFLSKP